MQADSARIAPLVQPVWSVQERRKIVRLHGFAVLCFPALLALHYFDLEQLPASGVCGQVLQQLRQAHGDDVYLDLARDAAEDAIRFTNSMYDAGAETATVRRDRLWSEAHVDAYLDFCECAPRLIE